MYITEKYWNHYIGTTDDSLTLVEYLAGKQKEEFSVEEIFADFGLDKLQDDFRHPEIPLIFTDSEGWEMEIHYAIDLITDLAAMLLECKVNGTVDLSELSDDFDEEATSEIRITATAGELKRINKALLAFVSAPLAYDLSEMESAEGMLEMATICEELRKELLA